MICTFRATYTFAKPRSWSWWKRCAISNPRFGHQNLTSKKCHFFDVKFDVLRNDVSKSRNLTSKKYHFFDGPFREPPKYRFGRPNHEVWPRNLDSEVKTMVLTKTRGLTSETSFRSGFELKTAPNPTFCQKSEVSLVIAPSFPHFWKAEENFDKFRCFFGARPYQVSCFEPKTAPKRGFLDPKFACKFRCFWPQKSEVFWPPKPRFGPRNRVLDLKKVKKTRFFAHFFESKFALKFRWFRAQKNAFFWWKNAKTQKNTFFRDFFAHFLSTENIEIFPYFSIQKNEQKKCPKKWKKRVFLCFFQQ